MNSHNRMDYEDDFIQHAMDMQDPPELWTSTPEDPFPDPDTDAAGFLEYCGESVDRLTGYIWFVTKEMIERGVKLKPLAKHDPYILGKFTRAHSCTHTHTYTHMHTYKHTHKHTHTHTNSTLKFKSVL